ncbi:PREDICTED: annexin D7-like [Fragaria vesca subsp. vesca]|uniref:annexin D7-like n=1 Tax=Fragaria vesca subsp. vesca TaxID=101020 RepID=UPI0002C31225|nr:PREDICTED: annexin D7-like [Fragaria vesca subsp. vesca]
MATLSVPDQVPPVAEDSENLHKAMQGWGADGKALISILAHRNGRQRCSIRQAYAEKYGEVFSKELEKKLSGDFLRSMLVWTPHPAERDAMLAYEAVMNKKSEAYFVIMEIGCTRTSQELFEVRQDYLARCKRSLEEDVAYRTSEEIRKLLVPLVTSYRYEPQDETQVDTEMVNSEAKILHEVVSHKDYGHEELIRILTTRSKPQLRATLKSYYDQFGNPINKDLKNKPKDEYLALLRATIKCLTCPEKYFEKTLRLSMKGLGTDEETLTRVVATRAEVDMKHIKEQYERKNNVSMVDDIKGDTSGDYLRILLALVN